MDAQFKSDYYNKEIDLKKIFLIITDYKKFIFIFTFLLTSLSVVYTFLKEPIYEIETNIQVGHIYNNYLIDPQVLKIFIANNFNNQNKKIPYVKVSMINNTKDILSIKIYSCSNDSAKAYLNKILDSIKNKEEPELKFIFQDIRFKINALEDRQKKLKEQLSNLNNKIKDIKDSFAMQILLSNINNINYQIFNNNLKIKSYRNYFLPVNMKRTEIVGHIKQSNEPIKPRKKMIVVVAFITALILAILLAFIIEFIKNIKKDKYN